MSDIHPTMRRLYEAAKIMKGNKKAADVARTLNTSQQVLKNWDIRGISQAGANKAQAMIGCNANWLLTGEGQMAIDQSLPIDAIPVDPSRQRIVWVVGKGSGGLMPERVWTDGDYPVGVTDSYAEVASSDPQAFLTEVVGQSMFPKYESGNFALVEPNAPVDIEDVVLVRLKDGSTMIKRLLSRRNGRYTFGSYNEDGTLDFPANEVTWVYYCAHEVPRKRIKGRF